MKRTIHILALALLLSGLVFPDAVRAQQRVATPKSAQFAQKWDELNFSHRLFDSLLRRHVKRGLVDHAGIRRHSLSLLREYRYRIANTRPAKLKGGKAARLAFWINAHNALVIQSGLQRKKPVVASRKGARKAAKRSNPKGLAFQVGGKWLTLTQIRDRIRKGFKEPRALFALAGGTAADPWLRARAFTMRKLSRRLRTVVRRFLAHPKRGVLLDRKKMILWLPPLFSRHAKDFVIPPYNSTIGFVTSHLKSTRDAAFIKANVKKLTLRYRTALTPPKRP